MKVNKSSIIATICLFVFAVITILRMANHIPWFDEAHAWTIAEQLNYVDMFNYTKNEGHFFIWQSLLYPFAHSHIIPYPYAMQALNWIFCFVALIVMWRFAPFNNCIKALITFSFPFLGCYGVLARCYSIGILFLFLLAALYDKKLKYPKTYALLLILCANTSVMALIGATAFGILFLFDIYKNRSALSRKDYVLTGIILIIGAVLILYQVIRIDNFPLLVNNSHLFTTAIAFKNTYVYNNLILNSVLTLIFAVPIIGYLLKDKKSLFFLLFTYSVMLILSFRFYGINYWHSYFFYIFLITALWINNSANTKIKKTAMFVLAFISFVLIFHYPEIRTFTLTYYSQAGKIQKCIENDEVLKNSTIIHNSKPLYELAPFSQNKSYKIQTYCDVKDNSDYFLLYSTFNDFCVIGNIFGQAQKYPDTVKAFAKKNVYAYTRKDKNPNIKNYGMVVTDKYTLLIKKYKCYDEYCFWSISVK